MTIDARDMGLFEPLYTFVSDEGENINIASRAASRLDE